MGPEPLPPANNRVLSQLSSRQWRKFRMTTMAAENAIGSPEGVAWVSEFLDVLNDSGVDYVCCGGTLLGLVRDGRIIQY